MSRPWAAHPDLSGPMPVLLTPFSDDGSLDVRSFIRQVEHVIGAGASTVVCFGLASECYKLTDSERHTLLRAAVSVAADAAVVIAGTDHAGLDGARARAVEAVELGAGAVMLYPPSFVKPDPEEVVDTYTAVAAAIDAPVIVQDAPAWTGVPLPITLLTDIRDRAPNANYVKIEAPPTAEKVRAAANVHLVAFGGFGAVHLAEELDAGIAGFMPGPARPAWYHAIWQAHQAGDSDSVLALHRALLPLLSAQLGSLDLFVSVQKELLADAGIIASTRVRSPGRSATRAQLAFVRRLLGEVDHPELTATLA